MGAKKNPRHAKKEAKQQLANKNGKKPEGGAGGSFFTWFMVLALLGVWTSVAVVWFDLVDYQGVVAKAKDLHSNLSEVIQGKLGSYDADNDGDFDLEDVQVMLDADIDSSIPETLENLSEEASGWLYGFFTFVYDIMTPFEIEEEEEQVGVATKDITAEDQAVKEKVRREDEKPQEVAEKQAPREGSVFRDPAGKLKEALKRQLAMIHARIEAKKIARLALTELRSAMAAEEEERQAQRAAEAALEEAALKASHRTEAKLFKVVEKMEREEMKRAEEEKEEEAMRAKARREREKEKEEKKAKREREEKREKAEKDKKVASKRTERRVEGDDADDRKTRKKEGKRQRVAREKRGALGGVGKK